MAKYKEGVLGGITGTIGPVVGATWKDIRYLRSRRKRVKQKPTLAQQVQQAKFSLVSKFVHSISELLKYCYPATPEMTGINSAFSWIYKNALEGSYPGIQLVGSKILVSRGEMHNAVGPAVTNIGNGMLQFSWTDNTDGLMAREDDRSVLLAHCPGLQQSIYTLDGATRRAGAAQLNAMEFKGIDVDTWICFLSADREQVATSIYTGRLWVV